ncbi:MAG TPA: glutamyl-tRNA reductase [Candidatus Eisenbacteria bacterium]|jgi:glutamyl-tRNA reductase|nr:glutamyl-tRNA reductase [Candidatus Eisenbacteria bacterium]
MSTAAGAMTPELEFFCVGLNHETSPLEIRDALVLSDEEVGRAIRALRERAGASEALVISTCNRTEVYARGAELPNPPAFVAALLQEIKGLDLIGSGKSYLYTYREPDSIRHLFRVACGLDSQILGEPQITGQVKDSLTLAGKLGGSGPVMERLLDAALRCAKRARTETGIGRGPVSSAYAAVNLATKVLGSLADKKVLLIGAGEMAGLAACHFMEAGVAQFMVANRSKERAEKLGATIAARAISLEAIPVALPGADIVVSATSSNEPVVREAMVRNAMKIRKNRPLLFLDLAVPRDVEPQVSKLPNVFVHDLDALGQLVAQSLAQRRGEVPKVEAIIESEMARFLRWHRSLAVKPTVTAFRTHFEDIAKEELDRHRGRFRPEDHAALEALVHGIVQKLLHRPTTRLSRADDESEGIARVDAVRDLFGIGQEDSDADRDAR